MARARKKSKPELSPEAIELIAQRFKVLSDPTRLRIIQELFERELSVQEIISRVGTSQANVSKHLGILVHQGLLSRRKDGLFAYYAIADDSIYALCDLVCGSLADRFEKVRVHFKAG